MSLTCFHESGIIVFDLLTGADAVGECDEGKVCVEAEG